MYDVDDAEVAALRARIAALEGEVQGLKTQVPSTGGMARIRAETLAQAMRKAGLRATVSTPVAGQAVLVASRGDAPACRVSITGDRSWMRLEDLATRRPTPATDTFEDAVRQALACASRIRG